MSRTPLAAATLSLASMAAVAVGFALGGPALLESWRLGIVLTGGIAAGALALLAIGRLLDNGWHEAIRDELLPIAATLPLLALLAAPLLLAPPASATDWFGGVLTPARTAWFSPDARRLRLAFCLAAWLAATGLIVRRRCTMAASAITLALTTLGLLVATVDWIMLMRPLWWSKLLPFCVVIGQLGAALALAFLLHLAQREKLTGPSHRSLASGLLALALIALWSWYAQFLTAWSGNQPDEARWYVARLGPGTALLAAAAACQIAGAAVLVLFARQRAVLVAAALLLMAAYGLHGVWLLRPARLSPPSWLDLAVAGGLCALWIGWVALAARAVDRRADRTLQA